MDNRLKFRSYLLPNIASITINNSLPPSRAGNGIIFKIARLTEIIPTRFKSERIPVLATSVVIAKTPTGPDTSFGLLP